MTTGRAGSSPTVEMRLDPGRVVAVGPLLLICGLLALVFLWREVGTRGSRALLLAGAACCGLALGLDFLEGLSPDHPLNPWPAIADRLDFSGSAVPRLQRSPYAGVLHLSRVSEEAIEMLGITLLWLAVLRHWLAASPDLLVRLARR